MIMSTADGWDLTVPDDANELLAELRRHGVMPGQRLHVVPGTEQKSEVTDPATPPRRLSFTGMIQDGPTDLSTRTDEYLAESFGRD